MSVETCGMTLQFFSHGRSAAEILAYDGFCELRRGDRSAGVEAKSGVVEVE
jgi:hypothetical protein